jgi:hypothetical protein
MRIDITSGETSQCDPQVVTRQRDGVTYYGLRMRFLQCKGVTEHQVTIWADSLDNLHVFAIVMQEKVESHKKGTPSEMVEHV